MKSSLRMSAVLISVAALSAGVVGFVGVQTAIAGQPVAPAHTFPRNANDQTYGSELEAGSPAEAPDLISAWATNGRLGYVRKSDLHPPAQFSTPEEALSWQAKQNQGPSSWTIPVWDVDGTTQIGVYPIVRGTAGK